MKRLKMKGTGVRILVLLLMGACAQAPGKKSVNFNEECLGISSIKDFGRAAFIEGCVRMANSLKQQNVYFWCLEEGKKYIQSIDPILEGP